MSYERHESAAAMILALNSLLRFVYAHQSLRIPRGANRKHQAATDFQLGHQRLGYVWSTRGDENRIVGSVGRPTQRTVETFDCGVIYTQRADSCLRFTSKLPDSFQRINLARNFCQDSGLITASGANLQHAALLVNA